MTGGSECRLRINPLGWQIIRARQGTASGAVRSGFAADGARSFARLVHRPRPIERRGPIVPQRAALGLVKFEEGFEELVRLVVLLRPGGLVEGGFVLDDDGSVVLLAGAICRGRRHRDGAIGFDDNGGHFELQQFGGGVCGRDVEQEGGLLGALGIAFIIVVGAVPGVELRLRRLRRVGGDVGRIGQQRADLLFRGDAVHIVDLGAGDGREVLVVVDIRVDADMQAHDHHRAVDVKRVGGGQGRALLEQFHRDGRVVQALLEQRIDIGPATLAVGGDAVAGNRVALALHLRTDLALHIAVGPELEGGTRIVALSAVADAKEPFGAGVRGEGRKVGDIEDGAHGEGGGGGDAKARMEIAVRLPPIGDGAPIRRRGRGDDTAQEGGKKEE